MLQSLMMYGFVLKEKIRRVFTDETGEVNIVAIVVLIAIAVMLALFFRKQIGNFLTNLFSDIDNQRSNLTQEFGS